jgi:hypothetical protein
MYKLYNIFNEVKWSLDKLKQAIIDPNTNKPYLTSNQFKKANYNAWQSAEYQNLLTTLFPNLTPEEIKKVALDPQTGKKRFCTSTEFKKAEPEAYDSAKKLGILYNLYFDAKPIKNWTPEEVKQGAIDCKTGEIYTSRNAFFNGNRRAHDAAQYHGMLDQLIPFKGELGKKLIYVFEFYTQDGTPVAAYIGLTSCSEERKKQHTLGVDCFGKENETAVTQFIKTNPELVYKYKELTDFLDASSNTREEQINSPAGKAESYYEQKYKDNGWKIINKKSTGRDFGMPYKETQEELINIALSKHKTYTDLQNNDKLLYQKIWNRNIAFPGFRDRVKQAFDDKNKEFNIAKQNTRNQELINIALSKHKTYSDLQNNDKALFYQIFRNNQKSPEFRDRVKQAFDERNKNQSIAEIQRLQKLADISEIKIRPQLPGINIIDPTLDNNTTNEIQYFKKPAVMRNKDVPSTNYYRGLLKTANITQSQFDKINSVLNNIDKNNKKATEKEYTLLQALKTGNFKYSTKN